MPAAKHRDLSAAIAERIAKGDYPDGLPGERRLAEEFGVSYMTARRAVQHLVSSGTLRPSRSTRAPRPPRQRRLTVTLVLPAWDSAGIQRWRRTLDEAVDARGGVVRPVSYVHHLDSVVTEALASAADLVAITLPAEVPPVLESLLVRERRRLVSMFHDLSGLGIVSIDNGDERFVPMVAEHIAALGHRRTAVVNTQGASRLISARIDAWTGAASRLGLEVAVHDQPVPPFEPCEPAARDLARRILGRHDRPQAVFCTTADVARGVLRAVADLGLMAGRDIAVATCDQPSVCRINTPSITTLDMGHLRELWERALARLLDGADEPLRILQPAGSLVVGESTRPQPGPGQAM